MLSVIHLLDYKAEVEDSILQALGVDRASSCIAKYPFQIQIAPNVQSMMRLGVPFQSIAVPMIRFCPKRHLYVRFSNNPINTCVFMVPQFLDFIPPF